MVLRFKDAYVILCYPCHRHDDNRGVILCRKSLRIEWVFNSRGSYRYYAMYGDGLVVTPLGETCHPDINEDGTLRAWRT